MKQKRTNDAVVSYGYASKTAANLFRSNRHQVVPDKKKTQKKNACRRQNALQVFFVDFAIHLSSEEPGFIVKSTKRSTDYSGFQAHPGRSSAQSDRASARLIRSGLQPMLAADQHTC